MRYVLEEQKKIPVAAEKDVVVVGGGPTGLMAAIAAARSGASVLLLEMLPFAASNMVNGPLEAIMTFHDTDRQIVGGIPQEFVDRLVRAGGSPGHIPDDVGYCKTLTPFDPEIAKLVSFEMLEESKVELLLQTKAVGCLRENRTVKGVIIENKSGRQAVLGKVFVDCSGDGDLCFFAGADFEKGKNGSTQPMTALFRVGGADTGRMLDFVKHNKRRFKFGVDPEMLSEASPVHLWGFGEVLDKGFEEGFLSLKRKEIHVMTSARPGELVINYTRAPGDGTDGSDVTRAQRTTVKQAHQLVSYFKKEVPGFEKAYIISTGVIGIRETRRIRGLYMLSESDIVQHAAFQDVVARGAFPIDIHQPDSDSLEYKSVVKAYDIPLRSMVPAGIDNVLMAGRCLSASHEGIGSVRITATCLAMGQSAGTAAAVCALEKARPADMDVQKLQHLLVRQGALL